MKKLFALIAPVLLAAAVSYAGEVKEITIAELKPLIAAKKVVLLDANGPKSWHDGHIAGATHIYWQETLVDAKNKLVFLPPDKLKELFAARGVTQGQKLVTYCEIGLQASHVYFVAKYLGYDAAMFDGSIHQWSHMNNLPVVAGTTLR